MSIKILLNSKDRVNSATSANDCEFRVNWGAILDDGKYRVSYSICKQIKPITEIPWVFRVQSSTLIVPTTVDGITLTNTNVSMINDTIRGSVFNFSGNAFLSLIKPTPVNSTKTFWLKMPIFTSGNNNVYSTTKMPIWFNGGSFLTVAVNFGLGGGGDVVSTIAQTSGAWIFYAITTTATQTLLYVNGNLVKTGNLTWGGDTAAINFGAYSGASFLTGRLDDMRLYSSTLTASDINALYTRTLL
jgi:hypothetical protein